MALPKNTFLALTVASGLLAAGQAAATTVTLDFDVPRQKDLASYSEDGFTITDLFGSPSNMSDIEILGESLFDEKLVRDETMSITADDGALFQLVSFAFAGEDANFFTDRFEIIGLLNGVEIVNFGEFTTDVGNLIYQTVTPTFSPFVDTLHIVGIAKEDIGVHWDDIVLRKIMPIPLPAGSVLLISGMAALVVLRRRARR